MTCTLCIDYDPTECKHCLTEPVLTEQLERQWVSWECFNDAVSVLKEYSLLHLVSDEVRKTIAEYEKLSVAIPDELEEARDLYRRGCTLTEKQVAILYDSGDLL